jgi:hypothetical protein
MIFGARRFAAVIEAAWKVLDRWIGMNEADSFELGAEQREPVRSE